MKKLQTNENPGGVAIVTHFLIYKNQELCTVMLPLMGPAGHKQEQEPQSFDPVRISSSTIQV